MSFLPRLAGTAVSVSLLAGGYQFLRQHQTISAAFARPLSSPVIDPGGNQHFSPPENLERLELAELTAAAERARAAGRSLDIAIYAFTDRPLADLLVRAAGQGTRIQIYRDGEQYENEERNAARFRDRSTTAMFRGQHNIQVRVKAASRGELMHLKDWSDGQVLREGSANWSPAALKRQDNNIRFSHNAEEVKAFEARLRGDVEPALEHHRAIGQVHGVRTSRTARRFDNREGHHRQGPVRHYTRARHSLDNRGRRGSRLQRKAVHHGRRDSARTCSAALLSTAGRTCRGCARAGWDRKAGSQAPEAQAGNITIEARPGRDPAENWRWSFAGTPARSSQCWVSRWRSATAPLVCRISAKTSQNGLGE